MSSVIRYIATVFRGVDEVTPTINRINGSLTRSATVANRYNAEMGAGARITGQYERQMRAFGVTARYAIAGLALYKIQQALSNYKQFQSQLGSLNATLNTTNTNINALGQVALDVSTKTAAPLNEVQQSIQNIAQSIPGASRKLIAALAEIEAKGSRITGTDPRTFGATVLATARAFYGVEAVRGPRGGQIVGGVASQFARTALHTPRTTGPELANYLPTLARAANVGGFTLPQALGLFQLQMQQGGTVANNIRWLSQLMYRIRSPRQRALQAYEEAGLTPQVLESGISGQDIMMRLLTHALQLNGMSADEVQKRLRSGTLRRQDLRGPGAAFLMGIGSPGAIGGRQQSLAAFQAFATQYPQLPILEHQQRIAASTNNLDKLFAKWLDRNRMTQAANAFSNMTTNMLADLTPFINQLSAGVTDIARLGTSANKYLRAGAGIIDRNIPGVSSTTASRFHIGGALEIAGGVLAISGLKRFGAVGRAANALRRVPGLGRLLGRGAMGAAGESVGERLAGRVFGGVVRGNLDVQAIQNAIRGAAQGTPSSPYWVVIHPLSAQTVPGMFGGRRRGPQSGGGVVNDLEKIAAGGGVTGAAAKVSRFARATRFGRFLGSRVVTPLAGSELGVSAAAVAGIAGPLAFLHFFAGDPRFRTLPSHRYPLLRRFMSAQASDLGLGPGDPLLAQRRDIVMQYRRKAISASMAERLLESAGRRRPMTISRGGVPNLDKIVMRSIEQIFNRGSFISQPKQGPLQGLIDATFILQPTDEFRNLIKPQKTKVSVPTKLWADGSPPPRTKGRPTTTSRRR